MLEETQTESEKRLQNIINVQFSEAVKLKETISQLTLKNISLENEAKGFEDVYKKCQRNDKQIEEIHLLFRAAEHENQFLKGVIESFQKVIDVNL